MFRWIAIIAAVALAIGAAYGQSSSPSPQPTLPLGSSQMMGHPMMNAGAMGPSDPSMMQMLHSGTMGQDMGGPMMCHAQAGMVMAGAPGSYLEGRLAFVKAELAIDNAQQADWEKYAEAVRNRAQSMFPGMAAMHRATAGESRFPDYFDTRVKMLGDQLSGLKAIRDAAVDLYERLDEDQKRKADALLPMSLCM